MTTHLYTSELLAILVAINPWGSGGDASARNRNFLGVYDELKKAGMSEVDIARNMGFAVYNNDGSPRSSGTTQLRNRKTIAIQEQRAALDRKSVV